MLSTSYRCKHVYLLSMKQAWGQILEVVFKYNYKYLHVLISTSTNKYYTKSMYFNTSTNTLLCTWVQIQVHVHVCTTVLSRTGLCWCCNSFATKFAREIGLIVNSLHFPLFVSKVKSLTNHYIRNFLTNQNQLQWKNTFLRDCIEFKSN